MKSVPYYVICLLCIASLASCSIFTNPIKNRNKQYLAAKSIPPLRIPPGYSSEAFHNEYPVSDREYPEAAKEVSLVPPGL